MIQDKIVLVTGANKGIGFEICRQLAQKGFKVILTARNEQKCQEAAEKLKKEGLNVVFLQLDVTDEESIKLAAKYIEGEFGRLDVLINNAGIYIDRNYRGLDADICKIKETLETNTYGPLRVSKAFIPIMQKNNYGRIINISSRQGVLRGMAGRAPGYRISKAALNAVTRILASELEGTNILVNSVIPGHVRTDMGGPDAELSVEEGADTPVWLAIGDNLSTGKSFHNRQEFE